MKRWIIVWDVILKVAGLAGIIYETVLQEADRPELLLLFAAMVGLGNFMKRDYNGNGKKSKGEED